MSHLTVKTTGFSMLYYLFDEIINAGLGKLPPAYSSLVSPFGSRLSQHNIGRTS